MNLNHITTIDELREIARKRVPKMFYDYMESGSWSESTLRANRDDFHKIRFRQRVAVDMSNRIIATNMLGQKTTLPCALAPVGLTGMQHADGEILCAKAAAAFGIPYTLSTMSICSIEQLAEAGVPFWFQLYVMRDHEFTKQLITRAKKAGCPALMLTLDLQILGQRHKDIKNGLTAPPKLNLKNMIDMALRPQWCWHMLRTQNRTFGNIAGHAQGVTDLTQLSAWVTEQFDLRLNWDDVARIKDWWGGKLIVKGVMEAEDAEMAVKAGADALIVSNHGGRQLDDTISAISALPDIVQTVGKSAGQGDRRAAGRAAGRGVEIWMDGGIRSGQDMLKAIALGAQAVLIGRAFLYGLGAAGEVGVTKALNILHKEFDMTMALCGHRDVHNIDRNILKTCPF